MSTKPKPVSDWFRRYNRLQNGFAPLQAVKSSAQDRNLTFAALRRCIHIYNIHEYCNSNKLIASNILRSREIADFSQITKRETGFAETGFRFGQSNANYGQNLKLQFRFHVPIKSTQICHMQLNLMLNVHLSLTTMFQTWTSARDFQTDVWPHCITTPLGYYDAQKPNKQNGGVTSASLPPSVP